MTSQALAAAPADSRIERYRQAERTLWNHYGLEPTERFVELESPRVHLRIQEVGSGEPVLLIPGTDGSGPYWGPLVRELTGFRCLMLDRPGWGLSSALDYSKYEYKTVIADVQRGVLDALGLERCHVIGASIGDVWALRLAQQLPSRVGGVVLMGGGPISSRVPIPSIIKLIASPIGAIIVRLPVKAERIRSILRQSGHGASLDAGRIPDDYVDWRVALSGETDSMRNERDMIRAVMGRGGWRPGLTFDDAELAAIEQPTLHVYGTADPVGTVDMWRAVVGLLPRGQSCVVEGAGHVPWLDDPAQVASHVRRFLNG